MMQKKTKLIFTDLQSDRYQFQTRVKTIRNGSENVILKTGSEELFKNRKVSQVIEFSVRGNIFTDIPHT